MGKSTTESDIDGEPLAEVEQGCAIRCLSMSLTQRRGLQTATFVSPTGFKVKFVSPCGARNEGFVLVGKQKTLGSVWTAMNRCWRHDARLQ